MFVMMVCGFDCKMVLKVWNFFLSVMCEVREMRGVKVRVFRRVEFEFEL